MIRIHEQVFAPLSILLWKLHGIEPVLPYIYILYKIKKNKVNIVGSKQKAYFCAKKKSKQIEKKMIRIHK